MEIKNIDKLLNITATILMYISIICTLIALFYLFSDRFDKWTLIGPMLYVAIPMFVSSVIMFGLEIITKAAYLYIDNNKYKEQEVEK